jgi:hypothetical protein
MHCYVFLRTQAFSKKTITLLPCTFAISAFSNMNYEVSSLCFPDGTPVDDDIFEFLTSLTVLFGLQEGQQLVDRSSSTATSSHERNELSKIGTSHLDSTSNPILTTASFSSPLHASSSAGTSVHSGSTANLMPLPSTSSSTVTTATSRSDVLTPPSSSSMSPTNQSGIPLQACVSSQC